MNQFNQIKVVILCGGQGTRLRDVTQDLVPKPMVQVAGRPIVWHIMAQYARHGFKDFILCLGYRGQVIKDYFLNYDARERDLTVRLGVEQNQAFFHNRRTGLDWSVALIDTGLETQTAGRLQRVAHRLPSGPFFLTYGDGLANVDHTALLKHHRDSGLIGTVTSVRPPGRFGELVVEDGRAVAFHEKPASNQVSGGFFVFDRAFVNCYISPEADQQVLEREPLQRLALADQLGVREHPGYWQPIDTQRDWLQAEADGRSGPLPWMSS